MKDLIILARSKGFIIPNEHYCLWDIQEQLLLNHGLYLCIDNNESNFESWDAIIDSKDDDIAGTVLSRMLDCDRFSSYKETLENGLFVLLSII